MKTVKPPPGKRFDYTDGDPPRDSLMVCQLAFLHDVLMGDGDPTTGDSLERGAKGTEHRLSLHEALSIARTLASNEAESIRRALPAITIADVGKRVEVREGSITILDSDGKSAGSRHVRTVMWADGIPPAALQGDGEALPAREGASASATSFGGVVTRTCGIVGGSVSLDDGTIFKVPIDLSSEPKGRDMQHATREQVEYLVSVFQRMQRTRWGHGQDDYDADESAMWRTLLTSPQLSHLNVVHAELEHAETLVRQIVKLDRLPKQTPLEGLELLFEAWCEYDVNMHLASGYKRLAKLLYAVQLLTGWLLVLVSCLDGAVDLDLGAQDVIFGLTVFATLVASLEVLLNAKTRWQHLRASAGVLESTIWMYRTRVGAFELDDSNPDSRNAEAELCATLTSWRTQLVGGGDLQLSALKRAHKERRGLLARCFGRRIYRHRQFSGELPASAAAAPSNRRLTSEHEDDLACENEDDFHSPMRPDDYIALRVRPKLAFYRARIPHYARRRTVLRCFLFACTASGSIIAYLANEGDVSPRWAVVVTAAAAAFTSWMEFADIGRKVERYTRAVVDIQNLLSSWKSLSDVERSNPHEIAELVHNGESILSNERIAWVSTANRSLQGRGGEKGDDAKGTDGEQGKGGSQTKSDGKSGKVAAVAPA